MFKVLSLVTLLVGPLAFAAMPAPLAGPGACGMSVVWHTNGTLTINCTGTCSCEAEEVADHVWRCSCHSSSPCATTFNDDTGEWTCHNPELCNPPEKECWRLDYVPPPEAEVPLCFCGEWGF